MKALQRKIMRGIYYAYAIRLMLTPGVWQGVLMLVSAAVLVSLVSVPDIIHNVGEVRVSELGSFVYHTLRGTEIWNLLLTGLFILSLISLRTSLSRYRYEPYTLARG